MLSRRKPYTGDKPSLKVKDATKRSKDFQHTKDLMDYFISISYFQDETNTERRDLYKLYNAYNNKFQEELFTYITNPLNTDRPEHQALPARLRPYSILRPNADLLLGEFRKRPLNYQVIVKNQDAVDFYEEGLLNKLVYSLEQRFW